MCSKQTHLLTRRVKFSLNCDKELSRQKRVFFCVFFNSMDNFIVNDSDMSDSYSGGDSSNPDDEEEDSMFHVRTDRTSETHRTDRGVRFHEDEYQPHSPQLQTKSARVSFKDGGTTVLQSGNQCSDKIGTNMAQTTVFVLTQVTQTHGK